MYSGEGFPRYKKQTNKKGAKQDVEEAVFWAKRYETHWHRAGGFHCTSVCSFWVLKQGNALQLKKKLSDKFKNIRQSKKIIFLCVFFF